MPTRSRTRSSRAPGRPSKGAGPRLSRQRVLKAALGIIDREGVEALGIRKLAARLGVAPNTLYSYVRDKSDVIQGAIGLLFAGVEVPPQQGRSWKRRIRDTCVLFRQRLVEHPNVVAASDFRGTLPFVSVFASLGSILREAGFEGRELVEATFSVSYYTIGFVTVDVNRFQRDVALRTDQLITESAASVFEGVTLDDAVDLLPYVRELDLESVFVRGLDSILDGLAPERRRSSRTSV